MRITSGHVSVLFLGRELRGHVAALEVKFPFYWLRVRSQRDILFIVLKVWHGDLDGSHRGYSSEYFYKICHYSR